MRSRSGKATPLCFRFQPPSLVSKGFAVQGAAKLTLPKKLLRLSLGGLEIVAVNAVER